MSLEINNNHATPVHHGAFQPLDEEKATKLFHSFISAFLKCTSCPT